MNLAPLRSLDEDPSQFAYLVTNNQSGLLGRPVSMASIGLDVFLFDFSYKQFKITNAVIHLINSMLVGWLSFLLFSWFSVSKKYSLLLALCTTVFWLILPIHVSTVMYPVQRMAQLSTIFVLLGLTLYGAGRTLLLHKGRSRAGIVLILTALLVCLPLGLFSKENAILLLPLMFLIEITFFRNDPSVSGRRIRVAWTAGAFISVIFLAIFWTQIVSYINADYRDRLPYQSLLTQSRILFSYLQEIVFPSNSRFGYFHDDIAVSESLFEPIQTLYAVLAVVIILAISIYGVLLRRSIVAFGILFFFIAHALESSILPLELYFEHRNYLPSVGVVIALVASGYFISKKINSEPLVAFFFIGFLAITAFISVERNIIWNSPDVGIALSELNHPDSPRSIAAFAIFQAEAGFYESSLRNLARIQELSPSLYAAVEVQKLYATCVNRFPITEKDVSFFNRKFSVGSSQYFNQGLSSLTVAFESGRCATFEPSALVALSRSFLGNPMVPASTHKRMGELMLAGNERLRGIEHLMLAWRAERLDVRSSILLFELLLSHEQYDRAEVMIKKLDAAVDESGVDSWEAVYSQAKGYLQSVR
ncbi:hypothetical protein QPM17_12790 [Marinobacter sp. TBZ242]|uniref:Uncharacterized protein n=1 Tax=Marinobacter azerbaijanicus TaxID=3050455 RepID=A0ABT7IEC4_9GAMM|nr:hypothetical protein [Marinobacter sp. TBZ242]MDL0432015.1 hypothetical protein [Marinobacter sp. TBZ242]